MFPQEVEQCGSGLSAWSIIEGQGKNSLSVRPSTEPSVTHEAGQNPRTEPSGGEGEYDGEAGE